MADPITILGTAGAVANIVDVLGKVIKTVAELRSQWKDADLTVLNLESQLGALNTALNKIMAWTESAFNSPHHQLVMDLDRCVFCCRTLINRIDMEISQFRMTAESRLDALSRFRLLLKTKDFENIQRMIEQQTGALTLLLTATNTTIVSEQNGILHQSQTRKVFKKMESDTASLYVHRDIDSFVTSQRGTSISSSKRSIDFDFDPELFMSRIYKRWMKGSVKKSLYEQQSETTYSSRRSRAIDRVLENDKKRLGRECNVLLLGSESRRDIMKMIHYHNGLSCDNLSAYRLKVFEIVYESAKALVDAIQQFQIAPEVDGIQEHIHFITAFVPSSDQTFDPKFKAAIEALLKSRYYPEVMLQHTEVSLPESAEYFLAEIARITSPAYKPNEMDVLRSKAKQSTVSETRIRMNQLDILISDFEGSGEMKKWLHVFENVTSIIFVVDLDSYDMGSEPFAIGMMDFLIQFDKVANSPWFATSSIILLFNHIESFTQKLANLPLNDYFPDYTGGNNVVKATSYFLQQFNKNDRASLLLYQHVINPHNIATTVRDIIVSVKDTVIENALRHSGIKHRRS
jgi:guanine nucleotide-binding protein G(i) subunit alpha